MNTVLYWTGFGERVEEQKETQTDRGRGGNFFSKVVDSTSGQEPLPFTLYRALIINISDEQ
jgi:hypothetical protein